MFPGHYQPHLPADLGFYDLRLPEARAAQAELAREYGIHGFCYYHYWFDGHRMLERPMNDVLASGEPDFPFCLCWANENWTRRWDGQEDEILLKQAYSSDDDVRHIRALVPFFKDPRYIRIDGRPLFLIYRLSALPDPPATLQRFRHEATASGLTGLYICNVESFAEDHGLVERLPLDAAVEFAPDWTRLPPREIRIRRRPPRFRAQKEMPWSNNYIVAYHDLAEAAISKPAPSYLRFPCVTPSWDNSARRREGSFIAHSSTPEEYEKWLSNAVFRFRPPSAEENLVFINAWNEWGEGNHLEPCQRWGRAYLEATRRALVSHSPA